MPKTRTGADRLRAHALNLFLAPTVVLAMFVAAAIYDPRLVIEFWRFYLPMLGIPYALSLVLWLYSRRLRHRADD